MFPPLLEKANVLRNVINRCIIIQLNFAQNQIIVLLKVIKFKNDWQYAQYT